MEPLKMFESKNFLNKIIYLSKDIPSWNLLLLLKQCDILGSKPKDKQSTEKDLTKIDDITRIVSMTNCYYQPLNIPYIKKMPNEINFNGKKNITVNVLIGLPGAGKSTLTQTLVNRQKTPYSIISRDNVRVDLGFCKPNEKKICSKEEENIVTEKCNEMILTAAYFGETIFIDNLNIKKEYRDKLHTLLSDYNVTWNYHYVETSLENNISRRINDNFNEGKFKQMILNIDWPTADEYDMLYFHKN
jgi:predicted kinase